MKPDVQSVYRKFRAGDFRLSAKHALCMAKRVVAFAEAEQAGLVRLVAEDERENYFDVYGEPDNDKERKAIEQSIERYGNYCLMAEVNNGSEASGDDWELVDSIGMCAGYKNPLDPFENYYVPDLMKAALDAIAQPGNVDELCTSLNT